MSPFKVNRDVRELLLRRDSETSHCQLDQPMMHRMVVLLSLTSLVCAAIAVAVNLPLNPQSSFAEEVQSIQHHVLHREITIELQPFRRCQKPTFRVRISGTSLYIPHLQKAETNKLIYTYPELSDEGVYFVEVIALMCAPFQSETFINTCVESVTKGSNIVTLPYKFEVQANATNKADATQRPRWIWSNKNNTSFLPTRYQKLNCQKHKNGWCPTEDSDLWQHNLYEWADSVNHTKSLQDVLSLSREDERNQPDDTTVRVCLIGDSHSRDLFIHGCKLNIESTVFVYIPTTYPNEFRVSWLDIHNCTYGIVSYGQWPASYMTKGHPYTQTKYEKEMRRVITLLRQYNDTRTQVFVHSVNYNGLMASQTSCPPSDFRTPPVIDMYNAVLKNLTREYHVGYIDLNHIIGPMWDSAVDFCHPSSKIYTAEVQWIFQSVLQFSLYQTRPVALFPGEVARATLVRYSDSSSVYLLNRGEIRAFPNGYTFLSMGYSFDDVKVLHAAHRKHVKLGPNLPVFRGS